MVTHRITVEVPPSLDAPAFARAIVLEHGVDLDPSLVSDAVLCVSEVVSNAVQHGRPAITLRLDSGRGGLGVEVTDHGGPIDLDGLTPADDDSPGGRGLRIVDTLARAWGVRPGTTEEHGQNKTVWFELHPDPDPEATTAGTTPTPA